MATSFFQVVTDAINDVAEFGYESEERLAYWLTEIRQAAERDLISEGGLQAQLDRVLVATYQRLVDRGRVLQRHSGIARYTLEQLRPQLRAELDRRIAASANLIRLNRATAINETLQRFSGWASSVPAGGTDITNRREVKANVRKSLAGLPFETRRVLVDQSHKLSAAISDIVAMDQDAIGAEWHSHWRQQNYQYRPEHKARDGIVYPVKDSWAAQRRFVKADEHGFYEDHERAGEMIFCRCWIRWIYALRDMPKELLTDAGRRALADARAKVMA